MKKLLFLLLPLAFILPARAAEENPLPFVSPIIGEHMVLQREKPNRVWGWTMPGAEVRLEINGTKAKALAGPDGKWLIEFTPPPAGGPYTMKIDGPQHAEFSDILVGDVWLCSGQSNMEFGLPASLDGAEAVKAAQHPQIRLFHVANNVSYSGTLVVKGGWRVCTPDSVSADRGFSAVAYYFGQKLHHDLNIPVGLIEAAMGGTPAESWTSPDALKKMPDFKVAIAELEKLRAKGAKEYGNYVTHWYDEYDQGQNLGWEKENFDDSHWKNTTLKSGFADLGLPSDPAVCWFRTEFVLPNPLPQGAAKILLGIVERMDTVYINGHWIGASAWVENPRAYPIAPEFLRPGTNHVTIRVLKTKADGGFRSPAESLKIVLGDGSSVPLGGAWRGAVSVDAKPPHPLPMGYENWPTMPAVLNLGMIRPLAPLALTGAIWYQGEANETRPQQYRTLLPVMIADWRALFRQGDFPFLLVSLPAFKTRSEKPDEFSGWTGVREAQYLTARKVSHTGIATTIDTGEADNIHPTLKQPVGERLALVALKKVYHRDVAASGPVFAKLIHADNALRIQFDHADGGLVCKGAKLGEFSIAGADRKWHWADARIEGNSVVVSSPDVPKPVAVRYAWQDNPLASLFNGAGLPAEPFRTDDWEATAPSK